MISSYQYFQVYISIYGSNALLRSIMTELTFAKSFLSTLDSRPIKLPSDHAFDPKTFEPKGPVRICPYFVFVYVSEAALTSLVHPPTHAPPYAPRQQTLHPWFRSIPHSLAKIAPQPPVGYLITQPARHD